MMVFNGGVNLLRRANVLKYPKVTFMLNFSNLVRHFLRNEDKFILYIAPLYSTETTIVVISTQISK